MEFCLIYVTCESLKQAKDISSNLLKNNLVACANISQPITSIYKFEGKIQESQEVLLLLKSMNSKFTEIEALIKQQHSYTTPCIVKLPIEGGNKEFLSWIKDNVN